ncbi:unnamed protein product [Diamesa hyperborea]
MEDITDEECITDVEDEVIIHEISKDRNKNNYNGGTPTSRDVTRYTITKYHTDNINSRHALYAQLQNAIR